MELHPQFISLTPIEHSNPAHKRELQRALEEAPNYSQRVNGHLPKPTDAEDTLSALPPGMGYGDKFVFGIRSNGEIVGCVDLIRGYPNRQTAMLGLLLLSEKVQKNGLGRKTYEQVEALIQNWAAINTVRIAIVETNDIVIPFWKKMGFVDSGIRSSTGKFVLEKKINPIKSRYSMHAKLTPLTLKEIPDVRTITITDGEALGSLMEAAYRGTIDDEGETLSQFISETVETLKGKWGDFLSYASYVAFRENRMVSATLVTLWKETPLLAYSVTHPAHQGQGLGTHLIKKTMNALHEHGHSELRLGVTSGNHAAENLYRKLGFIKSDQSCHDAVAKLRTNPSFHPRN